MNSEYSIKVTVSVFISVFKKLDLFNFERQTTKNKHFVLNLATRTDPWDNIPNNMIFIKDYIEEEVAWMSPQQKLDMLLILDNYVKANSNQLAVADNEKRIKEILRKLYY